MEFPQKSYLTRLCVIVFGHIARVISCFMVFIRFQYLPGEGKQKHNGLNNRLIIWKAYGAEYLLQKKS